jgi:hypothetical protein
MMAKNQNTFAKRRREMDKKAKAEEKRVRRQQRSQSGGQPSDSGQTHAFAELPADEINTIVDAEAEIASHEPS